MMPYPGRCFFFIKVHARTFYIPNHPESGLFPPPEKFILKTCRLGHPQKGLYQIEAQKNEASGSMNKTAEILTNEDAGGIYGTCPFPTENGIQMRIDVDKAVRALPPRLMLICRLIAQGTPKHEIYEQAGISHTTFLRDIVRIRRIFTQRNLQIYIND